jgi:hypothetical protein
MMRFRLRTLLIVVTAICFGLGYYVYRLGQRGHFGVGGTANLGQLDPAPVAQSLRERIGALPRHTEGEAFELLSEHLFLPQRRNLDGTTVVDQFFYRVTLSDGSVTKVGFWVHGRPRNRGPEERPECWISYAIYAHDSFRLGPADGRREERWALKDTYDDVIAQITVEQKFNVLRGPNQRGTPTKGGPQPKGDPNQRGQASIMKPDP